MNLAKQVYIMLGRLTFRAGLPFIRIYLRPTRRVYALVCVNGQVLVIKSWLSRNVWHLPGGGIRRAEPPKEALSRELHEELGLQIPPGSFEPVTSGIWQTDKTGNHYEILAVKLSSKPQLLPRRLEIVQASWLPPSELNSSNTPGEILAAVAAAQR